MEFADNNLIIFLSQQVDSYPVLQWINQISAKFPRKAMVATDR